MSGPSTGFVYHHQTFFAEETGYFMQLMAWGPSQLQMDVRRRCLVLSVTFMC